MVLTDRHVVGVELIETPEGRGLLGAWLCANQNPAAKSWRIAPPELSAAPVGGCFPAEGGRGTR